MNKVPKSTSEILERSVQISDGLRQTSGDGVNMAFDVRQNSSDVLPCLTAYQFSNN